ncbi:hypothetical protein AB0L88_01420 [Saccharopolyspora shandongensis]|uniref:hypothetical protein n=1 Tax=Saccharopolyspora shandongensis TaxID=418495 RepID=UPI00342832F6
MSASRRVQTFLDLAEALLQRSAEETVRSMSFRLQARVAQELADAAALSHPHERYLDTAYELIRGTYKPAGDAQMDIARVFINLCSTYDRARSRGLVA